MVGRGRDLTTEQRRTIIGMGQAGVTAYRIAIEMNISPRTVSGVYGGSSAILAVVPGGLDMDVQRKPHPGKTRC